MFLFFSFFSLRTVYDLHCSPNIIWVIKSIRMRCAGHLVRRGRREVHTEFWWGNLKERDHLEDPSLYQTMILRCVFKQWDAGMDWIDLAQDRDRWRAVVYAVMNLRFPYNTRNFLTSWRTVRFLGRSPLHGAWRFEPWTLRIHDDVSQTQQRTLYWCMYLALCVIIN